MQLPENIDVARFVTYKKKIKVDSNGNERPIQSIFNLRDKEMGLSVLKDYKIQGCYEWIKKVFTNREIAKYCVMNVGSINNCTDTNHKYFVEDDSEIRNNPYHCSIKVIPILMLDSPGEVRNADELEIRKKLVNCVKEVIDIEEKLKDEE